ncbi:enolase-like [Nelusetta ayraudi]|uniref:enolase-like n=1 Tax=Nelusetta ayraudi TaxID=303726 RepID=UPI003F72DEA8
MTSIASIYAIEILDSRGYPTIQVCVETNEGAREVARVPSGASTGKKEACEIRDCDLKRFFGKGVLNAIHNIHSILAPSLIGHSVFDQRGVDEIMIALDRSKNKSSIGANAMLGISIAVFKLALSKRGICFDKCDCAIRLPCPMMNLINGGVHADNGLTFQEFMIRPVGASSFKEALRWGAEIYQTLRAILKRNHLSTSVGDEGGFAPRLKSDQEALQMLREAILEAGFLPGKDVRLGLDCAASEFFQEDSQDYLISIHNKQMGTRSSDEQVDYLKNLLKQYPELDSIEDGLSESDWDGWEKFTKEVGEDCQIIGDDLFVTQMQELNKGIESKIANGILIKPNQVGTITETLDVIELAKKCGYIYIPSHRSGDTEDSFLSDFTVHTGAGQIKIGAPCRSERTCKYNRLLEIEHEFGGRAYYNPKVMKSR